MKKITLLILMICFAGIAYSQTWCSTVTDIRGIQTLSNGVTIGCYANNALYRFNTASTSTDNGTTVVKPYKIAPAMPGRWERQRILATGASMGNAVLVTDSNKTSTGNYVTRKRLDSIAQLKANASHTQGISTITGLQDSLLNHYTKSQADALLSTKAQVSMMATTSMNGLYAPTDGNAITVTTNNRALANIGTKDFTLSFYIQRATFPVPTNKYVFYCQNGQNGVQLILTSTGAVKLAFGNGSNFTTYAYTTSALSWINGIPNHLIVSVARSGNMNVYLNGVLASTIDISGSSAQSLSTSGNVTMFDTMGGTFYMFQVFNYAMSASDVSANYNNGNPTAYNTTPSSGFGANISPNVLFDAAGGYSGSGWSVSGGTANAVSASNKSFSAIGLVPTYIRKYLVTYSITAYTAGSVYVSVGNADGTPRNAVGKYTQIITSTGGADVYFRTLGTTTLSIDSVYIEPLGSVIDYKPSSLSIAGWGDCSGNGYGSNVIDSKYTILMPPPICNAYGYLSANGWVQLPSGVFITKLLIKNTTANAVTDGMNISIVSAGGTDISSGLAIPANATLIVDVNKYVTGSMYFNAVTAWNSAAISVQIQCIKPSY